LRGREGDGRVNEQHVAGFICALVGRGVTISQIECAVADCEDQLRIGMSIGKLATRRWDEPSDYAEAAATNLAYTYTKRLDEANR
jgi:ABC-type xylose transport system substrate-binding protein